MLRTIIATTFVVMLPIRAVNAQGAPHYRWEAGVQATTIQLGAPDEKPVGLGGRVGRELGNAFTVEVEAHHFPQNPTGSFGETQVVAGLKAGGELGSWDAFVKIRPGLLHFGGRDFRSRNSALNHAILDVGAVAERNIGDRVVLRIDFGNTVVFYGGDAVHTAHGSVRPGADSNLQIGFGLGFKF